MVERRRGERNRTRVWAFVSIVLGAHARLVIAEEPRRPSVNPAGLTAYADPRTRTLTTVPPAGLPATSAPAASQSAVGLVEQPLPDRAGVMVDLQGRFRSPLVATIGPNGTVQIDHATPDETR